MNSYKPILTLDFDGVLHSYSSGWKGASVIPDPPVDGAMQWLVLAMRRFEVHIHSSRSHQWGGRRAMKRWLREWLLIWDSDTMFKDKPEWVQSIIRDEEDYAEPYNHLCKEVSRRIMKQVKFPRHKPPAMVSLDDRAFQFTGEWPDLKMLAEFKPWNKR